MERALHSLLDILFPENCLGCGKKGNILCETCILHLAPAGRETTDDILAAYDYRDPVVRAAIWNLKYYHKRHLGQTLGKLVYEAFIEDISEMRVFASGAKTIIVPVPISKSRKKKRGYNQTLAIARGFVRSQSDVFVIEENIIFKNKDTVAQARITNRARRLRNLKDSFSIRNKEKLKGRTVIVIDDVTTTGATLHEIMNILKKSGTRKVLGVAVAH